MSKKYIPKKSDPVKLIKGKYYNTLTNRYVSLSVARRYNSYFKRNPKGTIHQSWGGSKFKDQYFDKETGKYEHYPVKNQPELIFKLWHKEHQFVKTKDIRGKPVLYSPFTQSFLSDKQAKMIKKLDYSVMSGKIQVHLHRLSKDKQRVSHNITCTINKKLENDFDIEPLVNEVYKILEKLRKELRIIKKYHSLGNDEVVYGNLNVDIHANNDYFPGGKGFGSYGGIGSHDYFNFKKIDKMIDQEIGECFDYFIQYFETRSYTKLYFTTINIKILTWANTENIKFARYRIGVERIHK